MGPFSYSLGDCVEIVAGKSAGLKGQVTQVRKYKIVVKNKKKYYGVRARSLTLCKKSDMAVLPNMSVCPESIAKFIKDVVSEKDLQMINIEEWRDLQRELEKKVFDVDD